MTTTPTTTPTSGAADLPEALRSIQRFEVVDCIDDKHVPAVIPKPHGPWVRYEDHIAALAAGQATAAQAGVPEKNTRHINKGIRMALTPKQIGLISRPYGESSIQGFDHILAFARAIEAEVRKSDDALLQAALDTLTCTGESDDPGHRCGHCDDYVDRNGQVRAALRARLGGK